MRLAVSTDRTNEIEEAASDWLIRRESGQWTQTDQARLAQWLDASALNRVAFLRLEHAWEESARLKALGAGVPGDLPPPPGGWNLTPFFGAQRAPADRPSPEAGVTPADVSDTPDDGTVTNTVTRVAPHRARRLAIAASVLLAIAAGLGLYGLQEGSADRYITPVGGLASVPMSDGSRITLNTDSQVRIALTQAERRIDLQQGEAFFEVAKDPNRPFVVQAGKKRVVAVGTRFSVRRDGDSIEVVVTEGKVRLEDATRPLRSNVETGSQSATPEHPDGPVFLTPGTIAHADVSGVLVQKRTLTDAETHLSWRSGVLMFRERSLADAVAEFNRYNVRKIVIADPAVATLKVEGNFRATNVDAFVRLLESGFAVRAETGQDRIVLRSR
jgi:transmembrane sensor